MNVAVLIPCFNEEQTVGPMIEEFYKIIPGCTVYVYDNNSTDNTSLVAKNNNAVVGFEPKKGKGYVIKSMFRDIDADVYIMIDGDGTYAIKDSPAMIQKIQDGFDMVIASRQHKSSKAYRFGHRFGNWVFTTLLRLLFRSHHRDVLSGYRALSKRCVKTLLLQANGFDIEVDMTIQTLCLNMKTAEIESEYHERPDGSESKLKTIPDGIRILARIISCLSRYKPMVFWSLVMIAFAMASGNLFYSSFILLFGILLQHLSNHMFLIQQLFYANISAVKEPIEIND
jgi:glycosyltransferase involved in cell wall biosynthesis